MRQFASGGFRIWNLSREAKWVYTGFGVFSLCAIVVSILFYEDLVGRGVGRYYLGDAAHDSAPAAGRGPQIEIPDIPDAEPMAVAMTYRKLLEVTHFHLFTLPIFLLVIAHLFMLTHLSSAQKLLWILAGWITSALHLAAPWLVRYGGPGFGVVYALSGAGMAVSLTFMTVCPMVIMWKSPPKSDAQES